MTTQTTAKSETIATEQIDKYTAALKAVAKDAESPMGVQLTSNNYVKAFGISHYLINVLKEVNMLVSTGSDAYTWNSHAEVDHDTVTKVILAIRKKQNDSKGATRVQSAVKGESGKDVNKVIANKLAEKSKSNATAKGLIPPVNEPVIDENTRVVVFDTPREVQINGVVTMHNVNSLVFSLQDARIVITASIGDSSVSVKIPNKPLNLSDRYQPGKLASYIIMTA